MSKKQKVKMVGPGGRVAYVSKKASLDPACALVGFRVSTDVTPPVPPVAPVAPVAPVDTNENGDDAQA